MTLLDFIKEEFATLRKTVPDAVILPFEEEIIALSAKFIEEADSGGAAPYYIGAITNALRSLFNYKPITPITGEPDEWVHVAMAGHKELYQNRRLSGLFKEGVEGKAHYNDGITYKEVVRNGEVPEYPMYWGSGSVLSASGEKIYPKCWVKEYPFRPKEFYVEIESWEVDPNTGEKAIGTGYWESQVRDMNQFKEIEAYYDVTYEKLEVEPAEFLDEDSQPEVCCCNCGDEDPNPNGCNCESN
jgi:hypothetical protein